MAIYTFDKIAVNCTQKVKPQESDKEHYIGLEHIDPECLYITRWGADAAPIGDKLVMKKGDVLFGKRRAYQRKVGIAPFDGIFSAHGLVLRPKEDVICKEFFPFFISSDQFLDRAVQISVGGLSPTVNWGDLARQEFSLPSLEEQKILADKLWAAYRVKESYRQLLATTDDMVKAKFKYMFFDKEWPSEKLPNIASYMIGLTYKPSEVTDNGVVVLRSGNIKDGRIDLEDIVRVSTKFKNELYVQKDDILMCSRNGSAQLVGKVALIPELDEPMTYGAFMTVIRSKYNKYLVQYFQTKEFRKQLSGSKSSVMNQVTQKMLDDIVVPLPSDEAIEEFADIATQAEATKASLRQSIDAIDRVIRSLINQ